MSIPILYLLATVALAAQEPAPRSDLRLRVEVPLTALTVDGVRQVVYELHLANSGADAITLQRVDVLDDGTRRSLLTTGGDALVGRIGHRTPRVAPEVRQSVAPGDEVVMYLEVSLPSTAHALVHRVTYTAEPAMAIVSHEGARVTVNAASPIVLSAPLRGGPWAAVYHPSWERGHRRVFYTVDGRARIPGRFAIDWFLLDSAGRLARGDRDRVHNWLGYGAEVLAVANGVVAAVRGDMPESTTVAANRGHTPENASGNFIILNLGDGRYAFYEHLRPGSIRVRPGDAVSSGQVIAALGFSGSGTGPHLHFHLADASSPLGAEGIPFVLRDFAILGAYDVFDAFGKAPWTPIANGRASRRTGERPAPNVVVRLGDQD